MEPKTCKHCGSNSFIKDGRGFSHRVPVQRYLCYDCGRIWVVRLGGEQNKRVLPIQAISYIPREESQISWPEYNRAQIEEKLLFLDILQDLCSKLPEEESCKVGHPKASTRDMAFCIVSKLYEGLSSRRASSDLTIAMQRGHIGKVPHFNTVLRYFNAPEMIPLLESLIRLSALPLKDFETTFAADASGLSSAFYSRWLDERLLPVKRHDWIKINIMCGVKSNIVTAIEVTNGHSNDCPHFPKLLNDTAEHFNVREVLADKGYLSRKNINATFDANAIPYIPFKANTTGKARGSKAWQRMFYYYCLHREEFMERYHLRSNVESTFSALKRKFSRRLLSKNEVAQVNEALAMLLCHNICVLIREAFENGITTEFGDAALLFPSLNMNPMPSQKKG